MNKPFLIKNEKMFHTGHILEIIIKENNVNNYTFPAIAFRLNGSSACKYLYRFFVTGCSIV